MMQAVGAVLLLAMTARPVHGQALANAAREAENQRKANDSGGMTVTKLAVGPLDGDLQEVELTRALFDQYAQARETVGRAFGRDIPLYERVSEAIRDVKRTRAAAGIYASEPKLKQAIEFNGFTVAEFVDVVLTVQRAGARAHAQRIGVVLSPIQTANTAFMRENAEMIRALEHKLGLANAWILPVPSHFKPY
jgi:hypothetical protein